MKSSAALLIILSTLGGCLGDDDPAPSPEMVEAPDWAVQALFAGQDPADTDGIVAHDHTDLARHTGLSTPNFQVTGWDPLVSGYFGATAGQHFCGDASAASEGGRRLAAVTSHTTDVAMVVLDVTDPTSPVMLGELVLPYVFVYDVALFDDGRYAVLAANPDETVDARAFAAAARPGHVPFLAYWRDACGNMSPVETTQDDMQYGYSTILVDLGDPTAPVVQDFFPHKARNMHSVSTATVDGVRLVASSGLEAVPCDPTGTISCSAYPRFGNLLSYFEFYTVEETLLGTRLVPYSFYSSANIGNADPLPDLDLAQLSNGHVDATIQKHPITGETIAYLANWDGGFIIVRLDGFLQVTHLASWGDVNSDEPNDGNVHSAVPLEELRDGRHYTLTGQEVCCHLPSRPGGEIVMLDTTDPSEPVPVARWTLPVEGKHTGYLFSTHYPVMDGDTMYIASYHAGVWAADASPEHWPSMPTLGVFLPDHAPPQGTVKGSPAPEVLEALFLAPGKLLVFDANSGAYSVDFTGPHPDVPIAKGFVGDDWPPR